MKLYTEEEVIRAIELSDSRSADEVLAGITPIELPSDEEIGKLRDEHIPIDEENMWSERFYFTIGAKWMRDKIQGGNNEQR
jgi:hypothetical protein